MGRQIAVVLYVVAMAAVIVGVDFVFFQTPILGTADSEYWYCLGVRSFPPDIPQASIRHGSEWRGKVQRGSERRDEMC
jgi:hypothetical protein